MRKTLIIVGCVLAVAALGAAILEATDSTWRYRVRSGITTGDLIYGIAPGTLSNINAVAAGQVLTSAGTSTKPAWSASPSLTSITLTGTGTVTGALRQVISAASGTTALTAAQSGALVANTGTSSTTTFTLPTAAAGINFCFVEAGDAGGELLITPASGDSIIGKIHGAENATGIATSAGAGIKNTAASNVRGDFTCLVAVDVTNYHMVSVAGIWAAQ